jgi:predicted ribosomally synthesized peptide with SipW-like signal peptide
MKKVLFSILAVVLAIGLMGSAFAYFTDVEKSTGNTMTAGTLDIQIADDDENYTNGGVSATFSSPPGLAPGDTFITEALWINNVGTIDISEVYARFAGLSEFPGVETDAETALTATTEISKYLILQSYEESADGSTWAMEDFANDNGVNANAYLDYWDGGSSGGWNAPPNGLFPSDGAISLYDLVLANNYGSGDHLTSLRLFDGGNYLPTPPIPAGTDVAVRFTFKLAEATPNNYQGDYATFSVDFIAAARGVYPDDQLSESGLEPLTP